MKRLAFISFILFASLLSCRNRQAREVEKQLVQHERQRVLYLAENALNDDILTITFYPCERSAGSLHDFYSEGDYWWPDPQNPAGPYIRKDGMSNPDNFLAHRKALLRFSSLTGALTSAWILTGDPVYAHRAMAHMEAWFINDSTKMNPDLLYAQAIKGLYTGRGIGIIDALPLVELARCVSLLEAAPEIPREKIDAVKSWFAQLLQWMNTHPYGKAEMMHPNNHGTTWAVQAAAYAGLCGSDSVLHACAERFRTDLLPRQMALNGSFPLELERTKPYAYSLFNLDAMCLLASVIGLYTDEDLWSFSTPEGKSLRKGIDFMYPFIIDKEAWPFAHDVMYWDEWPQRQPALFLSALALNDINLLDAWLALPGDPAEYELQRNLIIRYPLLWMNRSKN